MLFYRKDVLQDLELSRRKRGGAAEGGSGIAKQ